MRGLLALLLLLAGSAIGSSPGHADILAWAGRWAAETPGGKVDLRIDPAGRGAVLRLARGGHVVFESNLAPTDRPGVFEATATGLFAVLGRGRTAANPLEGEELVWAREAGDMLVVSRLAIASGKPAIDRARLERAGERTRLRLERLEGERMVVELEAELERAPR